MNNNDNTETRDFKPPVGWLAGRELLAALKQIAAYTFMGDKQDPKDWMYAETIRPPHENPGAKDTYWFDYIADTGDGMNAVYTIASLCMSDLWIGKEEKPTAEGVSTGRDAFYTELLPRGEFLFIGGDTAYHIADTASLKERFQTPFNWAYDDLIKAGKTIERRPLYGIPANHDYYDALDGFNRQFLKPLTKDDFKSDSNDKIQPQLALKGFIRTQTASYVALKLPFDWHIWGFDSQEGKMDIRQQAFFLSTIQMPLLERDADFDKTDLDTVKKHVPSKLIVATPEPTTVFGKWAKSDADIVKTFARVGLEPSFLEENNGQLEQGKCRLDISGDIHHYERYWGSSVTEKRPVNYVSVVAGGGGAFLHPSHTDIEEVQRQTQYPSRKDSHNHITQEVLNPLNIFHGGYLWLVGAITALFGYFAVTVPQSTWALFELIPDSLRPNRSGGGLLSEIRSALDTSAFVGSNACCSGSYYLDLVYISLFLGFLVYWVIRTPSHFDIDNQLGEWRRSVTLFVLPVIAGFFPLFFLINGSRNQIPSSFLAGILIDLFVITALLLLGLIRRYSDILIKRAKFEHETLFDRIPLWILGILGTLYAGFGFLHYGVYASSVMTFDLLIAVLWTLCTVGLVGLAVFVGGALFISNTKKKLAEIARFLAIGSWHALMQITVPVCLALYANWETILMVSIAGIGITLAAGRLFTADFLVKSFSLSDQKKIGNLLFAAWGIVGILLLLWASWGDPEQVTWLRILAAPLMGALFSCIWFGWYLAVSLAFHGHNNESGGGARSERYRHMIRFKLTENSLKGYVIGIDFPVTDFSGDVPKFRLVDVFTIKA